MENQQSTGTGVVAIVLAGDRTAGDPVAVEAGVSCKAIVEIAGKPMVTRVLDALLASSRVESVVLCGPPRSAIAECPVLSEYLELDQVQWLENLDSPSKSVEACLAKVPANSRVLLTTADHALLETEVVEYFLSQSLASVADATVALVEYKTIQSSLPQVKRTVIRFNSGGVCGCNLFTFLNNNGRQLVPFWRNVEQQRKRPWRMISGLLGPGGVVKYLMNRLTLDAALARVSKKLGITISPVILPYPRAGVDVDTPQDRELVENLLNTGG